MCVLHSIINQHFTQTILQYRTLVKVNMVRKIIDTLSTKIIVSSLVKNKSTGSLQNRQKYGLQYTFNQVIHE